MVDIVEKPTRSKMMSGIRGKDTGLERRLRSALHGIGLRFRKHRKDLPGTPHIVFPRWNAAVEVRGCFWHRHEGCRLSANPDDITGKWAAKFDANVSRDKRNQAELCKLGWRVAIVWECAVRTHGDGVIADRIAEWLRSDEILAEFGG